MTKLKPCPFCGGEAVVDKYLVRGYEPAISFEVRCSLCNQTRAGGYFDSVYKSEKWARRKAIEAWNTRAEIEGKEGNTSPVWHQFKDWNDAPDCQHVLVTIENKFCQRFVTDAWWTVDCDCKCKWHTNDIKYAEDWEAGDFHLSHNWKIIAWAERIEPYKGEENG